MGDFIKVCKLNLALLIFSCFWKTFSGFNPPCTYPLH